MIIREWNNYNPEVEAYNKLYKKRLSTYSREKDYDIEKKELIFQNDIRKKLAKCLEQNKYCILNLDTGLGKTYVTLSFLSKHYRKKTKTPILIIHGKKDTFVPLSMSQEIIENASSYKELHIFENAEHGISYMVDPERYAKIVQEFVERILK